MEHFSCGAEPPFAAAAKQANVELRPQRMLHEPQSTPLTEQRKADKGMAREAYAKPGWAPGLTTFPFSKFPQFLLFKPPTAQHLMHDDMSGQLWA